MGTLSPNEIACHNMRPTWLALEPIEAYQRALTGYLLEQLSGYEFNPDGMTEGFRLASEFEDAWPHSLPTVWELVTADEAGVLEETITQLNVAFRKEVDEYGKAGS